MFAALRAPQCSQAIEPGTAPRRLRRGDRVGDTRPGGSVSRLSVVRKRAAANRSSSAGKATFSAPVTASSKPTLEVLARATAQLAAVDELALELEVPINPDDQQLLKIALALDHYVVAGLFG